jgi:telomerase protein component 1
MKLPVPETWETLLSAKGNKASTWEELIEHKKLPFMAMLRNIRNLIFAGVHPKYHKWVMNKLTNEVTIAQSKQFPFRFFSAYEVIPQDLNDFKEKLAAANQDKQKKKAGVGAKKSAKPKAHITPQHMPDAGLFAKYREALDTAVKLATTHNVKPIRGATVVFCNTSSDMHKQCSTARGLGKFSQSHELGILLGLMCKYVCEECDFRIFGGTTEEGESHIGVELTEGTILDNMAVVNGHSERLNGATSTSGNWADDSLDGGLAGVEEDGQSKAQKSGAVQFPFDYLENLIKQRRKIDNFLVLSHQLIQTGGDAGENHMTVRNLLHKYRQEVNPDLLFVSVDLSGRGNSILDGNEAHPNDVMITGFSDSILRFIAERGDTNQLQYVEHIDEAKKLPKDTKHASVAAPYLDELDALAEDKSALYNVPSTHLHERWRTARIFISSTFLDMHGERDLITRHVIPELRERCRAKRIHISEVDLRWGITEEEANHERQLESCLSEVDRCRPFFVGLLGRRYGYTPKEYKTFSGDPKFEWLKTYPSGRSVTELEMHYGALKDPSPANHAFFYFRDNSFVAQVPQAPQSIRIRVQRSGCEG